MERQGSWVIAPAPDDPLVELGAWVVSTGRTLAGAAYQLRQRRFDQVVVILTESGRAWARLDDRHHTLHPGDLLVIPPDVDHGYGTDGATWGLVWAHLAGPAVTPAVNRWTASAPVVRTGSSLPSDLLHRCRDEMVAQRPGSHWAATQFAMAALGSAVATSTREPGLLVTRGADLVARTQEHLRSQLAEPHTLASIAAHMHVGVEHLCRLFRTHTATTPMRYLEAQRIAVAIDLVTTTDLPIAAVARQVGFGDPAHFSRVFRRVAGVPPSLMRSQHQ